MDTDYISGYCTLHILATSLDITINILRSKEHKGIREWSLDLLESANTRIVRLIRLRERLSKRIQRIARQGFVRFSRYGYRKKETIMLHNNPGPQIFCTKNKQIFSREGAGNLPEQNLLPEAAAHHEVPTDASTPSMCESLLHAAAATVNKGSGESELVSPPMVEYADKGYNDERKLDQKT